MKKSRVIIADTDATYIIPLQLKFIEERFNTIDLELITERSYYEKLFSSPQTVDVLIVSEDLYSDSLQRHNIHHTFVLQEEPDKNEASSSFLVNRIWKYSSMKELFNEIVAKSASYLDPPGGEEKQQQIILVTSAAGGVGKTTVALGLCAALEKSYKRVLYINADRLQYFQEKLSNPSPITASDVYAKLFTESENIFADIRHVIREEGFQYLPPFKAALMSLGIPYCIFEQIALSAKQSKDYDFVVVDADSTFDEWKTRLIDAADKVIVVTNQCRAAVFATNQLYESISEASSEKFLYICNNFDRDSDNALTDPSLRLKFSIKEYLQHFHGCDKKNLDALSKEKDVQKLAYLLI